ncbi:transketolase [Candidatus Peregrinibacteria bacterium]|nr:transketolase [Candidatus Peregrinibacteria bacterium]
MYLPKLGENLSVENLRAMEIFAKALRYDILAMLKNSQSGHPGGSLSSLNFLMAIYLGVIAKTGEKIIFSNGHITPAVYGILAELGYVDRYDLIKNFRKIGSKFEGHVTRHVPGIWYGTGPLGIGLAVASSMAWDEKSRATGRRVFATIGDGEAQEGEIYEAMNFAAKYALDNLIVFCDYNEVQLSDSIMKIMPINVAGHFAAAGWEIMEIDGHDNQKIWETLSRAYNGVGKPVLILAKTVMGKGVDFMEVEGLAHKATWHGKAPAPEQVDQVLSQFELSEEEQKVLSELRAEVKWKPAIPELEWPEENGIDTGKPRLYTTAELTDCRTAYGMALLDLAELNAEVMALDADLRASVMTKFLAEKFPERHLECGISEQLMMSAGGGLSLSGRIPFVSTFGAFMSSRAKDQARVNDINQTNVKMVATHAGLSVGEDGPTHQAIDDMGSFLGFLHTRVIEPADPNQTDRIIRYIAKHNGNFYVRMGRHKFPIITREDGQPFYGEDYQYSYGRTDLIRDGANLTVVATGAAVYEALEAWKVLAEKGKPFKLVAVSSIKQFDQNLAEHIKITGKVLTIEDHNLKSGLYSQVASFILEQGLEVKWFKGLGVKEYQLSGKAEELYANAGFFRKNIVEYIDNLQ